MTKINSKLQTLSEDQLNFLITTEREYREGMLLLNSISKSVTIYGGARILPESEDYKNIQEIGRLFGRNGWCVVTGGGQGAMAAALQGSQEVGGQTASIRINLEGDEAQLVNADKDYLCTQFTTRKYLLRQSDVFVVVPGGYGTLDELAELLNLIKTGRYPKKHVFLFNKKFWSGFVSWIEETVFRDNGLIPANNLKIYTLVDSPKEILAKLE